MNETAAQCDFKAMTDARSVFYRKKLPFRIGTTSYIVEADLCSNLLWLSDSGKVGEMQLVLFETPDISNIPTPEEVRDLKSIAQDRDMAFTVHLPCSIEIGSPDPLIRKVSIELFQRVVGLTAPLCPICWVWHASEFPIFKTSGHVNEKEYAEYENFITRIEESLENVIGLFPDSRDLAIENIHPHFDMEARLAEKFNTSVCIDVGHLMVYGQCVETHLNRWLPRCRNIHLHGISVNGQDHADLACLPEGFIGKLFDRLSKAAELKTVTMEVFGKSDFDNSLRVLIKEFE